MRPGSPDELVTRVARDVTVAAWQTASAAFWVHRAEQLEAARPRPGDYPGKAWLDGTDSMGPLNDAARWWRLTAAAEACRARATGLDDWVIAALVYTAEDLAGGAAA